MFRFPGSPVYHQDLLCRLDQEWHVLQDLHADGGQDVILNLVKLGRHNAVGYCFYLTIINRDEVVGFFWSAMTFFVH